LGNTNIFVRALGDGTTTFDSGLSSSVWFGGNWTGGWSGTLSAPTNLWISGNTLN